MKGIIYSGINNIYDVRFDGGQSAECRIKGKILKDNDSIKEYNPLAPGDYVEVDLTESESGKYGLILSRYPRKNRFARWNRKRESWQTVAANLDILFAVISVSSPPFRPRFVERVLIAAAQGGVPVSVIVNKIDQKMDDWAAERIKIWQDLGIPVLKVSALTGEGLEKLKKNILGKTAAFFGHSGVGKSTILNALIPGVNLKTDSVSSKYNRGRHVTNFGRIIDSPEGFRLVDTPGVREILVKDVEPENLQRFFPEIYKFAESCRFNPCSHTHEPGCAVIQAVENGKINYDRYENYLRILDELEEDKRW